MNLRLGHSLDALRPTLHNGPGWRVSFWVQGCVHRCTERCLNPHFLDPAGGLSYSVVEVGLAIKTAAEAASMAVEGITVLGGEPFEQAGPLAAMLEPLRAGGLSTMVYTGHTLEALRRRRELDVDALLEVTDLLVDGPFLPHLYGEDLAWRGSSNQRLLCLSRRYTRRSLEVAYARQGKGFSILVGDGRVVASGFQSLDGVAAFSLALGLSAPPERPLGA